MKRKLKTATETTVLNIPCPKMSNKFSTFFRILWAIPVFIVFMIISGCNNDFGICFGLLFLPCVIAIVVRKKYPKWWFDWNFNVTKFTLRVFSYLLLLRDEYPSFDADQAVNLKLKYPEAEKLSRGLPLVKWLLAIPHFIVLLILYVLVLIVTIIAWFNILFTGKYPPKMHKFVVGVLRWSIRVSAYAIILITDEYPAFSLV
jgi:hypothetical protein